MKPNRVVESKPTFQKFSSFMARAAKTTCSSGISLIVERANSDIEIKFLNQIFFVQYVLEAWIYAKPRILDNGTMFDSI